MTESCPIPNQHTYLRCATPFTGMGVLYGYHESAFGAGFLVGPFLPFLGKGTELLIFLSCLGAATTSSKHVSIFLSPILPRAYHGWIGFFLNPEFLSHTPIQPYYYIFGSVCFYSSIIVYSRGKKKGRDVCMNICSAGGMIG